MFTGVLPLAYLSLMNMRIYHTIRQNRAKHRLRSPAARKAGNMATILLTIGKNDMMYYDKMLKFIFSHLKFYKMNI